MEKSAAASNSRVLANLTKVLVGFAGTATLVLTALVLPPNVVKWARMPLISPLAATLSVLILALASVFWATHILNVAKQYRHEADTSAKKHRDEADASVRLKSDELVAMQARNSHLDSVMSELRIAAYYDVLTGVPNSPLSQAPSVRAQEGR